MLSTSPRARRQPKKPVPLHLSPASKKNALTIWMSVGCCLICVTILPINILESLHDHHAPTVHGVHKLMDKAHQKAAATHDFLNRSTKNTLSDSGNQQVKPEPSVSAKSGPVVQKKDPVVEPKKQQMETKTKDGPPSIAEQQAKHQFTVQDLQQLNLGGGGDADKPVARGLSGRPLAETPALAGAKRAHIVCPDLNVDSLAYWNDPVGKRDIEFKTPFTSKKQKEGTEQFITFSPDPAGWNNNRMAMEILFVLAAASGRTLVLPPKMPINLLNKGKGAKHRGFMDFFPLDGPNFPVKVISMGDFLKTPEQQKLLQNHEKKDTIIKVADVCDKVKKSVTACVPLFDYLKEVGHNPQYRAIKTMLIFDQAAYDGNPPSKAALEMAETYCGRSRRVAYWSEQEVGQYDHLHFPAADVEYRLLAHFYNMLFFSDPVVGNYMKRFVRDYLHYNDSIYCAAGKIVQALQAEALERGFTLDGEGGGGYSALHVRRGDFKQVDVPAKEWYDNTKDIWLDKEILYIATDESDKSFFDDMARHYDLRFLDDYWEMAGLSELDPNYMGMIDTIVATRGRAFVGTSFSTFSGYINRLRGYHGMSMQDSWYNFLPLKRFVHEWKVVDESLFAYEYPDGWIGIDADVTPERDKF